MPQLIHRAGKLFIGRHTPPIKLYPFRHLQAALPLPVGMAAFLARLCTLQFTVVIQLCPQTNAIRFECKYVFAHCSAHLYLQFPLGFFEAAADFALRL